MGGSSLTHRACGSVRKASRVQRGSYRCACGSTAQPDVSDARNIYQGAQWVSRAARGLFLPAGMRPVHKPEHAAFLRAPPNSFG